MKKLLFGLIILTISFAYDAQVNVSLGPSCQTRTYYSMANGEVANVDNLSWDLAFEIDETGYGIRVNPNNIAMSSYTAGDIDDWNNIDVNAIQSGVGLGPDLYNSDSSWSIGALNRGSDPSNAYDVGWGIYSTINNQINGDSIYILNNNVTGQLYKLHIMSLSGGVYTFKYANIDGSNEVVTSLSKDDFEGKNFGYYSMMNNTTLDLEPLSSDWDIVFTKYMTEVGASGMPYLVTGILHNKDVETAQIENVGFTEADEYVYDNNLYSSSINTIGYDWKSFDMSTFTYLIVESLYYFVSDQNGNIWKLEMTGFSGSSSCDYSFNVYEMECQDPFDVTSNQINNCLGQVNNGSINVTIDNGSGDYSYNWTDNLGNILSSASELTNLSSGTYDLFVNDNNTSCSYTETYEILTIQMDVNTSSNSSTCFEVSDGLISFDIDHSNGVSYPPYTILLNNGDQATLTTSSGSAFSLATGTYTYQITDGNGCVFNGPSAVEIGAEDVNFGLGVQANPSAGQSPFLVIFDNITPNISAYNFTWYFGDGTWEQNNSSFVTHTYAVDGLWDVVIIAEEITTGCTDILTLDDFIFTTGGVSCTHTATLNQSGSITGCPGSIELSCNTDASFTYQWNINGLPINGATASTYAPQTNGTYFVTIYQDNCPVNSNSVMVTFSNAIAPIVSASGSITSCAGGSVTLDAGAGYSSYAWSTGGTNQTETVTSSGDYTVTVMDASTGCMVTSSPYTVNASFMDPQQVCIVGMDSLSNYNRVVWEKPISDGIDYFNVYKEGNAADVYDLIGSVPYEDTAIFVDENSNTAVQAYRYKVSIVDSCGTESALGTFHKTIHLTINQGVGQTWNLIWNHYEGFGFPSYNIYRGTDANNMTLMATIASNLNSYTDLNPPGGVGIYYQVEVVNTDGCDPLKSTDYGVSRSNIATVEVVNQIELGEETLSIYPNPTRGNVTISASSALTNGYVMYDQQGRVVRSGALKGKHTSISLEELSRGSYTIKVEGNYKPMMLIKD